MIDRKCQHSEHTNVTGSVFSFALYLSFTPLGGHPHRIQRSDPLQEEPSLFGKRYGLVQPAPNSESFAHFLKGLTKL